MKIVKWGCVFVIAFACAGRAFPAPAPSAPVFQIRLVVAEGPLSTPPGDAERMNLVVTNSATGGTYEQVFWVGKTVLLDQKDLQATRVVTSTPNNSNVPGKPEIEVTFSSQGRARLAKVTRDSINHRLAILIDGQIISTPMIRSEIPGGMAMISGSFTPSEAKTLSDKINHALGK